MHQGGVLFFIGNRREGGGVKFFSFFLCDGESETFLLPVSFCTKMSISLSILSQARFYLLFLVLLHGSSPLPSSLSLRFRPSFAFFAPFTLYL
jgi:hypothetical protein